MNVDAYKRNLRLMLDILKRHDISAFLTHGTLLGCIREGTLLAHDDDIDLGIFIQDWKPTVLAEIIGAGFTCLYRFGEPDCGLEYTFVREKISIDLFFFYESDDDNATVWQAMWAMGNIGKPKNMIRYRWPRFSVKPHTFYDIDCNVPSDPEFYLATLYGDDWQTPKKKWDYQYDPKNHEKTNVYKSYATKPDLLAELKRDAKEVSVSIDMTHLEKHVTFIVKTFQRPACCERLIASIRKFYPRVRIIVADDGTKSPDLGAYDNLEYIKLDFDVGVSFGRNAALDRVNTEYFVTLDDDFLFTAQTKIDNWFNFLEEHPEIDLVGGHVERCAAYHGTWIRCGDVLTLNRNLIREHLNDIPIYDITLQFFMARTELIQRVRWDDELKMQDHSVFFYRCKKADVKVTYMPSVVIDHKREDSDEYKKFRNKKLYNEMYVKKLDAKSYVVK